jgi:hypothetical protein
MNSLATYRILLDGSLLKRILFEINHFGSTKSEFLIQFDFDAKSAQKMASIQF